jgi:putative oxidoreductase
MKKLLSTRYSPVAFNIAIFFLRGSLAVLICLSHGVPKIANFSAWKSQFYDPFHIGGGASLILSIFAEVFAAMFLLLGLFTRLAALVLVVDMIFASFIYHYGHPIEQYEDSVIFLIGFLVILLVGPGKLSVDGAVE